MKKQKYSRDNKEQVEAVNKVILKINKIEPEWVNFFKSSILEYLTTGKSIRSIVKKEFKELRKLEDSKDLTKSDETNLTAFIKAYAATHFGLEVK